MEAGIGTNERQRRTKALKQAAQAYVATVAMPALAAAIASRYDKPRLPTQLRQFASALLWLPFVHVA